VTRTTVRFILVNVRLLSGLEPRQLLRTLLMTFWSLNDMAIVFSFEAVRFVTRFDYRYLGKVG
jgi:hypothetical protein